MKLFCPTLLILAAWSFAGGGQICEAQERTVFHHDSRNIEASAQDVTGRVWALPDRPEELLIWEGDGWRTVADAKDWEGSKQRRWLEGAKADEPVSIGIGGYAQAGILVMWPRPEGGVASLWETRHPFMKSSKADPEQTWKTAERGSTTILAQHGAAEPYRQAARASRHWQPIEAPAIASKRAWEAYPIQRAALATDGGAWFLTADYQSSRSFAVWKLSPDQSLRSFPGPDSVRSGPSLFRRPRMAADATGAVWVWAEADLWKWRSKDRKPLWVFGRLKDDAFDFSPRIAGFPESRQVTAFALSADGKHAVAAVRGEGLWNIDLETLRAEPHEGPSLGADDCVWHWQGWPDGMEAALVGADADNPDGGHYHDSFWATLWLKRDGTWSRGGKFRVDYWLGYGNRPMPRTGPRWLRWDGHLILTGIASAQVLPLDIPAAAPRKLDWSLGLALGRAWDAYALPSGEALLTGQGTALIRPGELTRNLTAHLDAPITIREAIKGARGDVFARENTGPNENTLVYWDGRAARRWPVPDAHAGLPREASRNTPRLMQDDARRFWLFTRLDRPAWLLDPTTTPAEWTRYERLSDLLIEESSTDAVVRFFSDRESIPFAPVFRNSPAREILFRGESRADISLWNGTSWERLPNPAPPPAATILRFADDGAPEQVFTDRETRQMRAMRFVGVGWREYPVDKAPKMIASDEPDLNARPPAELFKDVPALPNDFRNQTPDTRSGWWLSQSGQLWHSTGGASKLVFPLSKPHPWLNRGWSLRWVQIDETGNHLFWHFDDVVIVPANIMPAY